MPAKPTSRRASRIGPIAPTERESRLAGDAARLLSRRSGKKLKVRLHGAKGMQIELPAVAVCLLEELLSHLANGSAVMVAPTPCELTTHQAAAVLGVSRPFLIKELDAGHLPFRMVGTHRRVMLPDLIAYRDAMDSQRHASLDELSRQAQELGMGY